MVIFYSFLYVFGMFSRGESNGLTHSDGRSSLLLPFAPLALHEASTFHPAAEVNFNNWHKAWHYRWFMICLHRAMPWYWFNMVQYLASCWPSSLLRFSYSSCDSINSCWICLNRWIEGTSNRGNHGFYIFLPSNMGFSMVFLNTFPSSNSGTVCKFDTWVVLVCYDVWLGPGRIWHGHRTYAWFTGGTPKYYQCYNLLSTW